ncbi:MAG: GNAT family N-acetyltransferase [Acidimicrobiia bacterium]|nr:GNAT family N-acetyltransferase [Acidimicrobiia bacterium]
MNVETTVRVGQIHGRWIDDLDAIADLRSSWDDLAVAASQPYGAPAWLWSWWKHAAQAGWRLRVALAFEGDVLIGVAPFFVDRGLAGGARYRVMGAMTTSRVDLLALPGRERDLATITARLLAAADPAPRTLRFDGIPATSPYPRMIREEWPGATPPTIYDEHSLPAPTVALDAEDFEAWLAAKSSNFRQQMRRQLRKIENQGGAFRISTDLATLDDDLADFSRLHHLRWTPKGGSGVLNPQTEAMLREAAAELIPRGRFRLWSLEVEGAVVSSQIFVGAGREVDYWLGGFDDEVAELKPSIMTIFKAIEDGFAAGATRMGLGSGGQPYKYRFAEGEDMLVWSILSFGPGAAAVGRLELAPLQARALLAERLSPRFKKQLRRVWGTVRRTNPSSG